MQNMVLAGVAWQERDNHHAALVYGGTESAVVRVSRQPLFDFFSFITLSQWWYVTACLALAITNKLWKLMVSYNLFASPIFACRTSQSRRGQHIFASSVEAQFVNPMAVLSTENERVLLSDEALSHA